MIRSARPYAALLLVAAAFALLASVLASASTASEPTAVEVVPAVHSTAAAPAPFLAALAPDSDFTPEQAAVLLQAADRVCEGFTAEVPVAIMSTELMGELSLTGEEARHFVNTAGVVHCAADDRA